MKMMDKIAEIAREKFKKNSFSFYNLLDHVTQKKYGIEIEPSDLYICIIEDPRFLSIGKQKWILREFLKYEEAEKIKLAMFGDKEYYEKIDENKIIPDEQEDDEELEDLDEIEEEIFIEEELVEEIK